MRRRFPRPSILVLLALPCIASFARAQPVVPDLCPALALVPEAATLGPAPIVHAGPRPLHFGATASASGEHVELAPDLNGRWLDEATGQRCGEHETPGAAAAGFPLVRLSYADEVTLFERTACPAVRTVAGIDLTEGRFASILGAAESALERSGEQRHRGVAMPSCYGRARPGEECWVPHISDCLWLLQRHATLPGYRRRVATFLSGQA